MVQESPLMPVNKPRRNSAGRMKSPSASRRTGGAGRKKKPAGKKGKRGKKRVWNMPGWLQYVAMGSVAALFVIGFYYFFIRPYAYRWKPCYGTKAYGVCLPAGYSVHGFDISHHQGDINWKELQKVQNAPFPVRFVFMKASEGGDFSDTTFIRNFDRARQYGFIRGAYHFFNPNTDAARQADFFIRSVKLEPGDLPPVLDIEKVGDNELELRKGVKTWLRLIERHYRVKPILYASYKFKERYLNDSIFNTYPYWIAHYYVDSVRYEGEWKFWQHTDGGTLPGIREQVDLNVFNGTLDELKRMTILPDSAFHKS
ncbi:glycoside hydrolase family 25 [Phocaeicola salanitronis DSM 18170]|uniref:Glycoside hydrolase family 25 n=1 Tax=Phocaeicola salanitronis (strain DSM 18170 / JCM 13657 / CCUG 60908 / BL78) TaxID=667015 RepID=F0R3Z6_PHOSB|nr:glycoside hydrolase family 25 protein [Phocaeicola salanitronis]ADY35571.1 glycoside hydrolase family 25 [Phocaeicola salanitronis DSM 18170]